MLKPTTALALALATSCALPSRASGDGCTGDPGYVLTATPAVALMGDPVDICLTGPPGDFVLLLVSTDPGPSNSGVGQLCLGAPLAYMIPLTMPTSGQTCIPTYIHCDPAMLGKIFYSQFVSFSTDGSEQVGRSNQTSVSAIDDGRGCNFCSGNVKARLLRMRYTGLGCAATNHSQRKGKVVCQGDPEMAPLVRIRVQDRRRLNHNKAKVYFDGTVALDEVFDIDAYAIGKKRLRGQVTAFIFDMEGNLIQKVMFHTSCCQPLHGYDQFGSLMLAGFIAKLQN
ncbi:MAG: hypothetical protein V2A76_12235 [Planctomycetota bacterium]